MRRRAAVAAVVALATTVVVSLGAGSTADAAARRAAFPPVRPTRVLILGDSVMAGAAGRYAGALPGRDVTVDAAVNRTTRQGADVVAQRGADWDVVVIMLAHNDGGNPGVYQPAAIRVLDELQPVPRVYWLTLHAVRPYYVGVNDFLRDQAARRTNLRIADWNALASANPGALAGDGLHLNGRGAGLMAGFVAQQVADTEDEQIAFLRSLPAPTTTTTTPPTTTTTTIPPTTTTTTTTTAVPRTTAPSTTTGATVVESPSASTEALDESLEADRRRGLLLIGVGVVLLSVATWRLVVVIRRRKP